MILAASEILEIIIPMISLNIDCSYTKLWVDDQQGEDEGEFLIFLLPEESYEADNVVEQEWSQHRCSHLGVGGENTDILIIFLI